MSSLSENREVIAVENRTSTRWLRQNGATNQKDGNVPFEVRCQLTICSIFESTLETIPHKACLTFNHQATTTNIESHELQETETETVLVDRHNAPLWKRRIVRIVEIRTWSGG